MSDSSHIPLPLPERSRWQPLRLGLVELFHYDSEEFWFRDGHLLLRGNNGTGKSKVLSLSLPFLFDAQIKPSRIEPDGDNGKKMAWNLLLGRHERRMGYVWVEFGRVDENDQPRYLTLGCGLSAVAARSQVDSWFFLLEQRRIGQDLWLMSPERVVLTRERLREALREGGQLFDTATAYRRAVDERLFHLGVVRYAALMDTLIQLRQPQLSKKPDESRLSDALTEALPPLPTELLADVADALNQLEEYRRELEEYEALEHAVGQFNQRYQRYAATQARRQARQLRSAQTEFDKASRTLHEEHARLEQAQATETTAQANHAAIESSLRANRTRLQELQSDPAMTSAKQLEQARRDADQRRKDANHAQQEHQNAQARLAREQEESRASAERTEHATRRWMDARSDVAEAAQRVGLASVHASSALSQADAAALVALPALALDTAHEELRRAITSRREQVALLLRRCDEVDHAVRLHAQTQDQHHERQSEAQEAAARREQADTAVEQRGRELVDAWQRHLEGLRQLQAPDWDGLLQRLAQWVAGLEGDNPARAALHDAQQISAQRLAQREAALQTRRDMLDTERRVLEDERTRLERGEGASPLPPHWRDPAARTGLDGAPLWQLVDFRADLPEAERAGLEAALEAAGLLDAWVCGDGSLWSNEGRPLLHDAHWQARPAQAHSLMHYLQASALPDDAPQAVPSAMVQGLLESVACGREDASRAEAWIGLDGRFRLGALAGAWHKPSAEFIGYAARAAARVRRLADIAQRLEGIAQATEQWRQEWDALEADHKQASAEWRTMPTDDALGAAHGHAAIAAHEFQAAQQRLGQAAQAMQAAEQRRDAARQALARDAQDMALPPQRPDLWNVDQALTEFSDSLHGLVGRIRELCGALREQAKQQQRELDARDHADQAQQRAAACDNQAQEARVRFETLHESIGANVEELHRRLAQARIAVESDEDELDRQAKAWRQAGETRAQAEQKAISAQSMLDQCVATRQDAVSQWQRFAATGLLAIALPKVELPPQHASWTIDPALTLARRAEQALLAVRDDDEAWQRIQNQVSEDFTELGRALTALSHQAQAETSDFGLVVHIVYQNRPERPDQLMDHLAQEVAQRRELLTAGEREVLENHLQAEIASAVQKLLRDAHHQVDAINAELGKRPTSTGVRFRLEWETLPEGAEGAPVGLKEARRRLLNTSSDLWSAEDRRVVGEMLQQRIAAERSRADAEQGGSLLEQLARALDHRRWHRFRVKRWDGGQWRALAGPASSGERALGLTVPLFAAVSSFYSQASHVHAPRLVLLDEVFAGIDDNARAHCWALIREFDLDFVVTSEREWACSAELPGVAIAQLQRREGIDAVHVSRWTWDGRARQPQSDPDRRFPSS